MHREVKHTANYSVFRYDWSVRECWCKQLHCVELNHPGLDASRFHRVRHCANGLHDCIDLRQHNASDERQSYAAGCVHVDWGHDFDVYYVLLAHKLYRDSLLDDLDLRGSIDHIDGALWHDMRSHLML